MVEREKDGKESPDASLKRQMRKLMMTYHPDTGEFKDVPAAKTMAGNVIRLLAACNDARASGPYYEGGRRQPIQWKGTWDSWKGKPPFYDELITLVRIGFDAKGNKQVEYSNRDILASETPRAFITTLQDFFDKGKLPPESERERRAREVRDEAARTRGEYRRYGSDPYTGAHSAYGGAEEEMHRGRDTGAGARDTGGGRGYRSWEESREQREQAEQERRRESERRQREFEEEMRREETRRERRQREQQEREARERTEREQREARERTEREARARAEAERAEAERKDRERSSAHDEAWQENRERDTQERAEREARKPENVFARRIADAKDLADYRAILKDMEEAFANQPAGDPDRAFSRGAYTRLRFFVLPGRAAELYRSDISKASSTDALRSMFAYILEDGLLKGVGDVHSLDMKRLGKDGEGLLVEICARAGSIFKDRISGANYVSDLADIRHEIEEFFGGKMSDVGLPPQKRGFFNTRLSEAERGKMTPDQDKRYEYGYSEPVFTGPLPPDQREEISENLHMAFMGPLRGEMAKIVKELDGAIEAQRGVLRQKRRVA